MSARPDIREPAADCPELINLIDGRWEAPAVELAATLCNSSTGQPLSRQLGSTPDQVERALDAAQRAHRDGRWRNLPPAARADYLNRIADALQGIAARMARSDSLTTGVIVALTSKLAGVCEMAFRAAAELTAQPNLIMEGEGFEVTRLPLGPAAVLAPWNAPAGIACHKIASALGAGCPVLFKPSEWAPHSAQLIAEAIHEQGLPDGVFQLLHGAGDCGANLTGDSRVAAVSFTGGLTGGRAVAAACAQHIRPVQLELGGNNPLIVLSDADLPRALDGIVTALTTLNGQWCRALGRLLVHEDVFDEVLNGCLEQLARVRLGNALERDSQMGPLAHEGHLQMVQQAISDSLALGAQIHQPTALPDLGGWFVSPTLVSGLAPEQTREEVFGPLAAVHTFGSDAEATALANDTPYGLAAYVFGEPDHAWTVARQIETGMVKINAVTLLNVHPDAPRPAWKLSGLGDEGTRETFEFFRTSRVAGMPKLVASG